ncbi:MAG: alkaline phosphatase D family protein [Betaproteobacteria bacterium]|jgi:alkaline phosphatase D|nr:alkaline phosphatase D family protein [Betaproteobacteria bacterium]
MNHARIKTTRRDFLLRSAALSAALALPAQRAIAQPRFERNPFSLGVASGYPQPDQVALWTRLAPDPLNGGGMPDAPVAVRWEIAADARFGKIVDRGELAALPAYAHAVHVLARGLEPSRWYWYRFMSGNAVSTVGRTRTAPAADDSRGKLAFAIASCQHYEHGQFAAYRDMAQQALDFVVHVGDYIYESSWGRGKVREHHTTEPYTLAEYRNRYAQYKLDPHLQAAHAAFPWLVTWDDHEVDNDYANDRSQDLDPVDAFLLRRAAAYRAYYEHMPLPPGLNSGGPDMKIYGTHTMGNIARIQLLDMRQYRDYHVCSRKSRGGGGNQVDVHECPERLQSGRSLLGRAQEQWLENALAESPARWNVIAQSTLMSQAYRGTGDERIIYTDGWDGYPLAREKLLRFVAARKIRNPVVIGGDVHFSMAGDLKLDFDNERSPVVASEFVGTSISSYGPSRARIDALLAQNPHVKFASGARRGYARFEITPQRWETTFRAVADPADAQSRLFDQGHYVVEDRRPGPQRA